MITTLKQIKSRRPCQSGVKLLKHLNKTMADDEPLPLLIVLDLNGVDGTLWCLQVRLDRVQGYLKKTI